MEKMIIEAMCEEMEAVSNYKRLHDMETDPTRKQHLKQIHDQEKNHLITLKSLYPNVDLSEYKETKLNELMEEIKSVSKM